MEIINQRKLIDNTNILEEQLVCPECNHPLSIMSKIDFHNGKGFFMVKCVNDSCDYEDNIHWEHMELKDNCLKIPSDLKGVELKKWLSEHKKKPISPKKHMTRKLTSAGQKIHDSIHSDIMKKNWRMGN